MLKLKVLRFKGIGRFVDEQVISIESLGKLVQLDGKNNNTKGSSGAGKSTVFNALDYLLGLNKLPSSVLKSRLSDDGIWAQGEFDYDGKPLVITRGKKLSVDLDGEIVTGNATKTEETLDGILGMPRDLFRKILHKRQKEGGFFLQMTPKETDSFLTSALGHGKIRGQIEKVEKEGKQLADQLTVAHTALASAKTGLKATQDALSALGEPPVRDMHQEVVLGLKDKSDKSAVSLSVLEEMLRQEESALVATRPKITANPFNRSVIEGLEHEYNQAQAGIRSLQDAEKDRLNKVRVQASRYQGELEGLKRAVKEGEESLKKATEVADQLKKLKEGKCFNCLRDWMDEKAETKLRSSIGSLRQKIEAGKQAASGIPQLEKLLEEAIGESMPKEIDTGDLMGRLQSAGIQLVAERQKEKDHQWEETKRNKLALDDYSAKDSEMRSRHRLTLDQARGQAEVDRRAFEAALSKLKAYEQARTRYESNQSSLGAQAQAYSQKVTELTDLTNRLHNHTNSNDELKRALKVYLSCSFDQALETIGENATTMIRSIPNMANATIELQGTKETQDGKVKEEVTAVIHMDGDLNVDIRSLCGGERTATDLAIDLSVIDLIESEANKGIDLFVLDEPFDGLDTVCIQDALEVLKNSNSRKRLVIVDHNPEVKEMVESKLVVVRDGTTSNVVQS